MKRFLGDNHYFFSSSAIYSFPLVLQSQIQFCWLCLSHTHHNLIHQERMQMTLSQRPSTLYQKKKKISRENSSFIILCQIFCSPTWMVCVLEPLNWCSRICLFSRVISKLQAFGLVWTSGRYPHKWHGENSFCERNLSVVLNFPLQSHIIWVFSLFQP